MEEEKQPVPFKLYTMTVKYTPDIVKLERLVKEAGGIFEGAVEINFLNYKNQPVSTQYLCIYHLDKEIHMEVLC